MTRLITAHTGELTGDELAAIRRLLDEAFDGDFSEDDWEHGLGGTHVLVLEGEDDVIAHGSLVMRRLLHGERSLRAGYVEGVAVRLDRRRAGHASTVMAALEALAPAYDLLALSSSEDGVPFYEARGWQLWRGPTAVLAPERHRADARRRRRRLRHPRRSCARPRRTPRLRLAPRRRLVTLRPAAGSDHGSGHCGTCT